ncbi:hypothetical protein NDU88_008589 [Pleurodeles waltl]|uniref:Uncharacterized protein n=1 Tax=Pleurodeles waltl TaxID=8319 RepID=A0AAV7QS62_PLEWA|nr:hypothetical protein NDU88_008589 [Pleurodeles waltl]
MGKQDTKQTKLHFENKKRTYETALGSDNDEEIPEGPTQGGDEGSIVIRRKACHLWTDQSPREGGGLGGRSWKRPGPRPGPGACCGAGLAESTEEEAGGLSPRPGPEAGPRVKTQAEADGWRPQGGPERVSLLERRLRPVFGPRGEARVALGRPWALEEQGRPVETGEPRRGYAPWSCGRLLAAERARP